MIDLTGIKNIIFDFGNVIMDIDFQRTIDCFKELGFEDVEKFLRDYKSLGFFSDYQEGKISDSVFLDKIREVSELNLKDEVIIDAWNSMLLDYNLERLSKLIELKSKYRILLLSNTNSLHYENFAFRVPGAIDINSFFHAAYYSHEMQLSKPSAAIFQKVLQQENIQAKETLFIDDLQENIDGAQATGMKAKRATYPNEWMSWV